VQSLRARPLAWFVVALGIFGCRGGAESRAEPAAVSAAAPVRDARDLSHSSAAPDRDAGSTDGSARSNAADAAPKPWPREPAPRVETDWCIEGVDALDVETCFVLPPAPTTTLLVYLHGIVPPQRRSHQKTNFETVVKNAARAAGVAALIPRGRQGLAARGHERWWGWPTGPVTYRRHAAELVAQIAEKQQRLEQLAGTRFTRRYVAGSSSGAYFAALLALHGGMAADGYGAISGGAGSKTAELPGLPPKPFYVGYGTHDSVGPGARALAELMRGAGWPVKIAAHPLAHGAHQIYLDEALKFFRESAH
jgi:predicted esterase